MLQYSIEIKEIGGTGMLRISLGILRESSMYTVQMRPVTVPRGRGERDRYKLLISPKAATAARKFVRL